MRARRSVALLAAVGLLLGACGDDGPSQDERAWADQAFLEVARINDVLAVDMLPAMILGDDASPETEADGSPRRDWIVIRAACEVFVDDGARRGPSTEDVPESLEALAESLTRYQEAMATFGEQCLLGAEPEDNAEFAKAQPLLDLAGEIAKDVANLMPEGAACPEGIEDRPASCDPA